MRTRFAAALDGITLRGAGTPSWLPLVGSGSSGRAFQVGPTEVVHIRAVPSADAVSTKRSFFDTTALFTVACWVVVAATVARAPLQSAIGFAILFAGVPAFLLWRRTDD